MTITTLFVGYVAAAIIFLAMDMIWFRVIGEWLYFSRMKHLLGRPFNVPAAVAFYVIYLVGIMVFAAVPGAEANDVMHAAMFGALFGFFAYATYDLTNLATLKDFPRIVVAFDLVWGTVLTATTATVAALAMIAVS